MTNSINSFDELSDEQLAGITGASGITVAPQINVATNVQLNIANAPTIGVAIGAGLNLKGANLNLGNGGLLGNTNGFKL
jgi:hypothetical protein